MTISRSSQLNSTGNIHNLSNPGQISGAKFNDINSNGKFDPGEFGLQDITLYLEKFNSLIRF